MVGVKRIGWLVTRFVQSTEAIPNFVQHWIHSDSPRVGIQSIAVLADLVIKNSDGAPKHRVLAVTIDSLLVGVIGLSILSVGHVTTTKKVPGLPIGGIGI